MKKAFVSAAWKYYFWQLIICIAIVITVGCKKYEEATPTLPSSVLASSLIAIPVIPTLQSSSLFPIGTAADDYPMKTYTAYSKILGTEFNSITPESAMKMDRVEWARNSYDFSAGDYIVNFAQQHRQRVHGHTLVWQHALPNWLINFKGDSSAWEDIFKTHIQSMVSHYKGKVASWDVANECIDDYSGQLVNQDLYGPGSGSLWRQHLGPNYIVRAFQYAHAADPNALLFYNDYGNDNGGWNDSKLNALLNLVKSIQQKGGTISGIGIQMHINLTTDNNNITATLKKMAATGLKIHISELDVSVNPSNAPNFVYTDKINALQANKYQFIAQTYKAVVPAAQRYGITTWEFSDAYCESSLQGKLDWRLPFDAQYGKKQAYEGYLMGLKN